MKSVIVTTHKYIIHLDYIYKHLKFSISLDSLDIYGALITYVGTNSIG